MGIGIIPVQFLDWKVYYEAYLQQLEALKKETGKIKKTEASEIVAAIYPITGRQVRRIVNWMETL